MRQAGFTLLEMMVAVVILGILATIVVQNYTHYAEEGDLASARSELMRINQDLTRRKVADPNFLSTDASKTEWQTEVAEKIDKEKMVTDKYSIELLFPDERRFYVLSAYPSVESRKQVVLLGEKGEAVKCKTADAANVLVGSATPLNSASGNCEPF